MRTLASIAVLTLFATTAFAAGEIYRWRDANGTWMYSDQPHPGAELVRRAQPPANSNTAAAASPRAATATVSAPNAPAVSGEIAQQVRNEAATAKVEQCKKAEEAYQKAIQARRMYKDDDKGNRTFLNDSELDAARLEARSNRDLACGPGA
jgi:predicted lipid-binding transport protein (Tim44 family)